MVRREYKGNVVVVNSYSCARYCCYCSLVVVYCCWYVAKEEKKIAKVMAIVVTGHRCGTFEVTEMDRSDGIGRNCI